MASPSVNNAEEFGSDDNDDFDIPPTFTKTKQLKEAVKALEDVQLFLKNSVGSDSAHTTSVLINDVASKYVSSLIQSTLDHFIKHPTNIVYMYTV